MTDDPDDLTTAAGWCAPSPILYGLTDWPLPNPGAITLPQITALRGSIDFTDRRTPAERAATDALHAHINRIADTLSRRRRDAIDAACLTALAHHWDVHVYEPPQPLHFTTDTTTDTLTALAYVGIRFTPAHHPIPTIHHHTDEPLDWTDWDDHPGWTTTP